MSDFAELDLSYSGGVGSEHTEPTQPTGLELSHSRALPLAY